MTFRCATTYVLPGATLVGKRCHLLRGKVDLEDVARLQATAFGSVPKELFPGSSSPSST